MKTKKHDEYLNQNLQFAIERMRDAGYPISSTIDIEIDSNLQFMGYTRIDYRSATIVIADWALDSDMLVGLLLHELAHIYFTETKQSQFHNLEIINHVFNGIIHSEEMIGEPLSKVEAKFLTDSFTHLQNIIADDLVFELLNTKQETKLIQEFFLTWVSDTPTGNKIVDSSLLTRNAFAIASLKRRNLFFYVDKEMERRNEKFLSFYKINETDTNTSGKFTKLETLLKNINLDDIATWDDFEDMLSEYFDLLIDLLQHKDVFLDKLK